MRNLAMNIQNKCMNDKTNDITKHIPTAFALASCDNTRTCVYSTGVFVTINTKPEIKPQTDDKIA